MSSCIFCAIAGGTGPADVVHRDDRFVAFRDINPKAPVHLLVIPVRHVTSIATAEGLDDAERAAMPLFIAETARRAGLEQSGYRVATNHGPDSRQAVFHLHWHVLGGRLLSDTM
ncbi:MAG TPA: HIT domain-containing protein [Miltoncostaeaceae bacterium]|nr:HIT domain-containing protein [Miltoncostaeaceae bacterium]